MLMLELEWFDLVILTLASFRLTRLIVYDEIFSFIRKPFIKVTYEQSADGELLEYIEYKGSGIRRWFGQLLSCHWCFGVWSASFIILIYFFIMPLYPLLLLLAIAGAAGIIQRFVER